MRRSCDHGDRFRPAPLAVATPSSKLVGGPGFEPGASRSRTVRAAKLRQPPTLRTREFYGPSLRTAPSACTRGLADPVKHAGAGTRGFWRPAPELALESRVRPA